ncbi:MAG: hypothetical protein KC486_20800, partial [Myxococcales bacterium]|nr:hypothetical protein [Myxococcales bacterium]
LPSAGDLEGGRASAADDSVESAGLVESEAPVESEDGVEDRSERHGPPFEGDAEDRADMRASTADDSVESEAFAHSENRVEDRSEMSAFAEGDAVEIDIEPEREAPAVREGDVEDGSDGSAFEADDAVESGGPPESEASADSGVHEDATGGLTAEDGPVADGSGLRETDPPLADAMSDDAGGPPEGLAERRGDPREAGWIPAAIDEGEQPSGEEWPPEEPPANEAVRAARVDSGAPTADNTRDGPSTVDGGEDPRESDE